MANTITNDILGKGILVTGDGKTNRVSGVVLIDAKTGLPATVSNSVTNNAPIAATSVQVALVAANVLRRSLRITNIGIEPVAIGAAGITWANRCVVLAAGAIWVEKDAANLSWYAICDATKTSTVATQEVIG